MILRLLISCIAVFGTYFWMNIASHDDDFAINSEPITFTNKDKVYAIVLTTLTVYYITMLTITAAIFASISLPYLIVSALTDKKTKLVYDTPFYIFLVVAVIIESILFQSFHVTVIASFILAEVLALLKLYGRGDRAMTVICGTIYGFNYMNAHMTETLLVTCFMILFAEVTFYIRAIREKNLNGPFKLKESRPLGPDLCLSTFLLLGVTIIL